MIATLSLVYVHGTDSGQQSAPANITIARGESTRLRVTVTESGAAKDMTGKSVVYAVAPYEGALPVIYRTLNPVSDVDGTSDLVLTTTDTEDLDRLSYPARFWLIDGTSHAPLSASSVLRLTSPVADLAATPTNATGEAVTLTIRGNVTFTAASEVTVTYANAAAFASAVVPRVGQPYISDSNGTVTLEVTAYTTTGFTLTASAEFTGIVPYEATGASA